MGKIIILGKNGQLGQEFFKILKSQKKIFEAYSHQELDVSDFAKVEKTIKRNRPSIVINTTAYHATALCEKNPLEAFNINCIAVSNLARISREIGAKFITFSTNYVFDGLKKDLYEEKDVPNPLQMYGLSKFAGELAALNEYSKGAYIIRTCSVFGGKNGSKSKNGNYILKILNEAKRDREVFASKKQIVNPTFSGHLALSTLDLISKNAEPGIYHLVNEGSTSWFDYAQKIIELSKIKNVNVKEFKNDEENKSFKSPEFSALKNSKAKKHGIVLPSIDDGLREYIFTLQQL